MNYDTMTLAQIKAIATEKEIVPTGDKRKKQSWIDALTLSFDNGEFDPEAGMSYDAMEAYQPADSSIPDNGEFDPEAGMSYDEMEAYQPSTDNGDFDPEAGMSYAEMEAYQPANNGLIVAQIALSAIAAIVAIVAGILIAGKMLYIRIKAMREKQLYGYLRKTSSKNATDDYRLNFQPLY